MNEPFIALIKNLLAPLATVERTMVQPFDKERHENSAEHSFMLAAVACSLGAQIDSTLDLGQVAQLAIVHDLVKVHAGDTTVWESDDKQRAKLIKDAEAMNRIESEYQKFPWISETLRKYEARDSSESRFVYVLDKIIPHMMILAGDFHPVKPTREAYRRTETIVRDQLAEYPKLKPYFDELCREFERRPEFFQD